MAFFSKKKILYFCISLLDIFHYTFIKLLITEKVNLDFLSTINWPMRGHLEEPAKRMDREQLKQVHELHE